MSCVELDFQNRRESIGALRYKTFVELLEWVKGDEISKTEIDEYDDEAIHLGVVSENNPSEIISYARILKGDSQKGIMMENEIFKVLLPENFIIPPRSIEVSRFCLNEKFQKKKSGYAANMLIFKSVFLFVKENYYKQLFIEVDEKDKRGYTIKKYLTKIFSLKHIGVPYEFQKGILTFGLMLSIKDFEKNIEQLR